MIAVDECLHARFARDLLAVSALSAAWFDQPAERIGEGLAQALRRMGASIVFVRVLHDGSGEDRLERAIVDGRSTGARVTRKIANALGPWLDDPRSIGPLEIGQLLGRPQLRLIVRPLGTGGMHGCVAFAAPSFQLPDELMRALVASASNAAATALAAAALNGRLRYLAADLARANAVKDELLGLVSHELRTPLTTILGMTDVLRRRLSEDAALSGVLADISFDAERLQRVIENMLALARLGDGAETSLEPVLLQRSLSMQVAALRDRYPDRHFELSISDGLPPVLAHPMYVEQIIHNLVTNSAKYSDPAKPVQVMARARGASVSMVVRDRGPMIERSELDRLFEPFYRRPAVRHLSGAGLGLAVCRRLVEAQAGQIRARARRGGGLEFEVLLPAISEDVSDDVAVDSPGRPGRLRPSSAVPSPLEGIVGDSRRDVAGNETPITALAAEHSE